MKSQWVTIVSKQFENERGKLDLIREEINDDDIPKIIEACRGIYNIRELWLGRNSIGAEGAKCLAAADFPNIRELNLYYNKIGAEGANYLSMANFPNLTKLDLRSNNIKAEGAKYLTVGNFPNLTKLWLCKNINMYMKITSEQKEQSTQPLPTSLTQQNQTQTQTTFNSQTIHTSNCYSNKRIFKMLICDLSKYSIQQIIFQPSILFQKYFHNQQKIQKSYGSFLSISYGLQNYVLRHASLVFLDLASSQLIQKTERAIKKSLNFISIPDCVKNSIQYR